MNLSILSSLLPLSTPRSGSTLSAIPSQHGVGWRFAIDEDGHPLLEACHERGQNFRKEQRCYYDPGTRKAKTPEKAGAETTVPCWPPAG